MIMPLPRMNSCFNHNRTKKERVTPETRFSTPTMTLAVSFPLLVYRERCPNFFRCSHQHLQLLTLCCYVLYGYCFLWSPRSNFQYPVPSRRLANACLIHHIHPPASSLPELPPSPCSIRPSGYCSGRRVRNHVKAHVVTTPVC